MSKDYEKDDIEDYNSSNWNGGYGYNPDNIRYEEENMHQRIDRRIEEAKARKRRELGL